MHKELNGSANAANNSIRTDEDWRVYADDNPKYDTDAHKYLT
jgi:hypothetical protein